MYVILLTEIREYISGVSKCFGSYNQSTDMRWNLNYCMLKHNTIDDHNSRIMAVK